MAKKIINATAPKTSFNYGVGNTRLYFNFYVTYEEPAGAGTINPSTLSTTLVYQKPGPFNTIQYVESAILQADGTWKALKENEARIINPPSPTNPNGSIGGVVNPNSSNYILGESTRKELVAKGPNTLNYAARQNAASVVDKSTPLTLNQVNQAYYISQSTAPGGSQIPPVLPLSPDPSAAPPLSPDPSADPSSGGGADPTSIVSTFQPEIGEGAALTLTAYTNDQLAISKKYSTLVYPRDHGNSPYDFIQIVPIEYIPGFGVGSIPHLSIERVRSRFNSSAENQRYKQTGTQIFLPMTPGISESNSVGWGSDELNPISAVFGQTAYNRISEAGKGDLMGALSALGSGLMNAGQQLLNDPQLSNYISAYFAGQAVNSNLLGRSGMVINPNLELLFQGPKLRSFRYNFRFTPRDADESEIIRAIIKVFKKTMAVRQSPGSLFLGVPSVYEIKYIYNSGGDHPFLNKIKPCALTSFNVNYTPDGSYMTYGSNDPKNPNTKGAGSMTSYTVDMQFDEIEPIYNEDIDDVDGPTMGY